MVQRKNAAAIFIFCQGLKFELVISFEDSQASSYVEHKFSQKNFLIL